MSTAHLAMKVICTNRNPAIAGEKAHPEFLRSLKGLTHAQRKHHAGMSRNSPPIKRAKSEGIRLSGYKQRRVSAPRRGVFIDGKTRARRGSIPHPEFFQSLKGLTPAQKSAEGAMSTHAEFIGTLKKARAKMGRSLSTNQLRASVLASTGLPLY